jgi:hypothetical protein
MGLFKKYMIMNWLEKVFKKKKKSYNTDCNYKLLIIDDKAEHFHEILGVTEKRADELAKICLDAYKSHDYLHATLEEVVSKCKHTNEVVFATLITQKVIASEQSKDRLHHMLKGLFSRD